MARRLGSEQREILIAPPYSIFRIAKWSIPPRDQLRADWGIILEDWVAGPSMSKGLFVSQGRKDLGNGKTQPHGQHARSHKDEHRNWYGLAQDFHLYYPWRIARPTSPTLDLS